MTGSPRTPRSVSPPAHEWRARVAPERLVLVGSVLADVALKVPALPPPGGDVLASSPRTQAGGAFNVAAAATRLGLPSALIGHVGDGPFGDIAREALRRERVELLLPRRTATGDTGFCVTLVEPNGERTFVTSPGIESRLTAADLEQARLEPGDALWISGYDLCYDVSGPAIAAWVARLPRHVLVLLDPGPLAGDIPADRLTPVLARADIVTLSVREARLMAGATDGADADLDTLGHALLQRLPEQGIVILRNGAHGCRLYSTRHGCTAIPALRDIPVVDTTGAGDAHTGALLAHLAHHDVPTAATLANVAAGVAVMREGSATGPTRAELDLALTASPLMAAAVQAAG
ncbi:MAG: PfkB family carbohydrate kinase [Actinomycetes bacterium]